MIALDTVEEISTRLLELGFHLERNERHIPVLGTMLIQFLLMGVKMGTGSGIFFDDLENSMFLCLPNTVTI